MTIVLPAKERRPLCSDNAVFEGVRSAPRPVQRQPDRDRPGARLASCGNEQRWSKNRDCERRVAMTELSSFFIPRASGSTVRSPAPAARESTWRGGPATTSPALHRPTPADREELPDIR